MAALAICAITAAQVKDRTDTQAPPPVRPDQPPPAEPGMIPLTIPEIKRLLAALTTRPLPRWLVIHWDAWTRRHQARARWFHKRTRLARDAEIALLSYRNAAALLAPSPPPHGKTQILGRILMAHVRRNRPAGHRFRQSGTGRSLTRTARLPHLGGRPPGSDRHGETRPDGAQGEMPMRAVCAVFAGRSCVSPRKAIHEW